MESINAAPRGADWTKPQLRYIQKNITKIQHGFASMDIESKSLTACDVTPDGSEILLGFVDTDGKSATIRLPLNQAGTLAMTLPELINKALRSRFNDQSLRYAYPLASWAVEQSSDPQTIMVTLKTVDGFTVCFSMEGELQSELGEALVSEHAAKTSLRAN
jgi:hypothetical protein